MSGKWRQQISVEQTFQTLQNSYVTWPMFNKRTISSLFPASTIVPGFKNSPVVGLVYKRGHQFIYLTQNI